MLGVFLFMNDRVVYLEHTERQRVLTQVAAKLHGKQCDTNLLFVLKYRKEITAWLS